MNFPAPSPVYLGPPKWHGSDNNKPIYRIVIHSTVGPTKAGSARVIARYFKSNTTESSAHYAVDAEEIVQITYDSVVAYHDGVNTHEIGVEMCDYPTVVDAKRWEDQDHKKLLRNTVHLVADLCLAYDVPVKFLSVEDLKKSRSVKGITTHNNESQAYHESTHWDPGSWPQEEFITRVQKRVQKLKNSHK